MSKATNSTVKTKIALGQNSSQLSKLGPYSNPVPAKVPLNVPPNNPSKKLIRVRASSSKNSVISIKNGSVGPIPIAKFNSNGPALRLGKEHNSQIGNSTRGVTHYNGNIKMPDMDSDKIQNRLKKKSPWFDSLVQPIQGAGVKIPDAIGVPTGTLQNYTEITVAANANGVSGLRIMCPYPNSIPDTVANVGSNYQTTTTASNLANLEWGYPGAAAGGGFAQLGGLTTLASNALGVRVVSADVIGYSETTSLTDKGEFCGFQTPFRSGLALQDYAQQVAAYGSSTVQVSSRKPMKTLWYPVSVRNDSSGTIDYKDFVNPSVTTFYSNATPTGIPYWTFGVVGVGLEPLSVCKYKICINYEFIPKHNVLDIISASPSPQDLQEEELVIGWTDDLPKSGVVSLKEATSAPTISKVEENESGFGMFFNVLEELVPYAAKAAPMLMGLL